MKVGKKQSGSITLALLMITVVAGIALTSLYFQSSLSNQSLLVVARVGANGLSENIRLAFDVAPTCPCNFIGKTIDTTTTTPPDISLSQVTMNCNPPDAKNTVVTSGKIMDGGWHVGTIQLKSLSQTGPVTYSGNFQINVDVNSTKVSLKPISLAISLTIDAALGTPSARPISACTLSSATTAPEPTGISSCPAGFKIVGTPESRLAFCIQTDLNPAKPQLTAYGLCARIVDPVLGRANLCSFAMWNTACIYLASGGSGINNLPSTLESVQGSAFLSQKAVLAGGASCSSISEGPLYSSMPYRCCFGPF